MAHVHLLGGTRRLAGAAPAWGRRGEGGGGGGVKAFALSNALRRQFRMHPCLEASRSKVHVCAANCQLKAFGRSNPLSFLFNKTPERKLLSRNPMLT